jgi:hypothetical protein
VCFVLLVLGSSYYDAGLIVVYFYKGAVLAGSKPTRVPVALCVAMAACWVKAAHMNNNGSCPCLPVKYPYRSTK